MAVHQNDIGTAFVLTIVDQNGAIVDVSTASVKQISFRKPDSTVMPKTASFVTNGKDGQIQYVTLAGDLNQVGVWLVQGFVTIGTGSWDSDIVSFQVMPNLS